MCWNHKAVNVLDGVSKKEQPQAKQYIAYYDFPMEHWKHLRTSNIVESPFSRVRLRTAALRRFKSQTTATCLIWKTMMISEKTFRKLNAPQLVEKVAEGRLQKNGKETRVAA